MLALASLSFGCGDSGGRNGSANTNTGGGTQSRQENVNAGQPVEHSGDAGTPAEAAALTMGVAAGAQDGGDADEHKPGGRESRAGGESGGERRQSTGAWQVLSVSGSWVQESDGGRTLARGDTLAQGSALTLREPSGPDDYITLIDPQNRIVRRECRSAADCRNWKPPATRAADSASSRIIKSALDEFKHEEEVLIDPVSRGAELKDAVLLREGARVDIRPAIGRLSPGRHLLEFEPAAGAREGAARVPFEFTHVSGGGAPLRVEGLSDGLYRVRLADESEDGGGGSNGASLVLVSPPETYRKALARFRKAQALTREWGDSVEPELAQRFLRAYLARLAREGAGAK
jgi:hypothetical protein